TMSVIECECAPAVEAAGEEAREIRGGLILTDAEARLGARKEIQVEGRRVTVDIPAGVADGEEFQIPGVVPAEDRSGAAGDLVVKMRVLPPAEPRSDPSSEPRPESHGNAGQLLWQCIAGPGAVVLALAGVLLAIGLV